MARTLNAGAALGERHPVVLGLRDATHVALIVQGQLTSDPGRGRPTHPVALSVVAVQAERQAR